ncbi:M55 family metallopeptidase [Edaphobacillus lindanitolerans]|uniref:D-aminopeptidase DppA. Metallo peptidase. MEROPS family M55 n=1 Tax=Edaphobacillus lindanitolerans TaxID=550447 RepID=A0A1U7PRA6_9BACI|nr:M55 family metallopeptidase [Edaphobacillus lindanitolerans]SIT87185.1 D-aminopeptidase DppA. Metallo peptidase. MEROPS family M55 [Edaphobacillus lindanitolerans]
MNIYLSVDMEGITGIPDYTFVDSSAHNYEIGRELMTADANAVIEGALVAGAKQVLVNDSHSKMNNLLPSMLHPDAELINGGVKLYSMVEGIDGGFDGAILAGYHSRAGQPGVMSHSMIHGVRNMWINDREIGEIGFNAYVAGYHGVPILMVAGDDGACREAEELIPGVVTAAVKKSLTRSAVRSLSPSRSYDLLMEKAQEAISNRSNVQPLTPPENPVLRIEFTNYGQAEWAAFMPGCEIEPGTTIVRFEAKDILEAYRAMLVMIELALQTTYR